MICVTVLGAIFAFIILYISYKFEASKINFILFTCIVILGCSIILGIDFTISITQSEVWSGKVIDWYHKEEWDEYHPPVTTSSTDSKGHTVFYTKPGYWEHHNAINKINTTDEGWISVKRLPSGQIMDDTYPNEVSVLKSAWKYGTPSASTHFYINKVKKSYSLYKHKEINIKDFPDIPDYPNEIRDYIYIDRILGNVPNKESALKTLAELNTYLNKPIEDKDNPGKKRSWKQVNVIFVNVGEKPENYGIALQDKWQNGNKNDFVISFSMDKNNNIKWVYPFSWSEQERLKIDVREYMMKQKQIKDFNIIIKDVGSFIERGFVRKEFKDFNYLHVEFSLTSKIICIILQVICFIIFIKYRL